MRFTQLPVLLFCVFFVYGFINQCIAQRTLGVSWEVPENKEKALDQLESFEELGITYLELSERPGEEVWERIEKYGFLIYAQLPLLFPTIQTLVEADSSLLGTINSTVDYYNNRESVQALGLFKYGPVYKQGFEAAIRPIIQQVRESYNGDLYYVTTSQKDFPVDSLFSFKIHKIRIHKELAYSVSHSISSEADAYFYLQNAELNSNLEQLKRFLESIASQPVPVFVEATWLFEMIDKSPRFRDTIQLYNSNAEFIFPTPKEQKKISPNHSYIVLLLVLIWFVSAVNYHMSPVYKKSASRYFLGHIFFVEDVMKRHIRSIAPAIIILIQNILLAGICLYSLAGTMLTPLGLQAFFYHYPWLSTFADPLLSAFYWGCVIGGIITIISLLWIRISNKELKEMSQVLNLYAWPLQINFVVATLVITVLLADDYITAIPLLGLIFLIAYISAFIITAIDTSKYLSSRKGVFLAVTAGIYTLLWIGWGSGYQKVLCRMLLILRCTSPRAC